MKKQLVLHIKQFIRYFFVGGIASVADYGTSNIMYFIIKKCFIRGNELMLQNVSSIFGIVVGLLVNYFMALKFVFNSDRSLKDFIRICMITVVSCLLTFGLTTWNVHYLKLPFAFFKIVTMGIAFIWNYLARSMWVYNRSGKQKQALWK